MNLATLELVTEAGVVATRGKVKTLAQALGARDVEAAQLAVVLSEVARTVLTDLKALVETAEAEENRGNYFALVLDTIWWRRCVYFVTLALALVALAFPLIYALLEREWAAQPERT